MAEFWASLSGTGSFQASFVAHMQNGLVKSQAALKAPAMPPMLVVWRA